VTERGEFPPEPLRQYALIADGERGALCGPHGELVWMCAPRWHDPAVFSTLIGGSGAYAVTPEGRCVWGGYYEPKTLIWRNSWATDYHSTIECRDALARPASRSSLIVVRRVIATQGAARVNVRLDVRAGFGSQRMDELRRDDDGTWTARAGELYLRWVGAPEAQVRDDGSLDCALHLAQGEHHDLVLQLAAHPADLDEALPADELWRRTVQAWSDDVPDCEDCAAPRDSRHAYAVLCGLTSVDGGMVAAATTSLPERAGAATNYDYRYAWLRDQAFTGIAVAAAGPHRVLTTAASTVADRLLAHGSQVAPAYTVDGAEVPDQTKLSLPGYPGATVECGNHVNQQWQLDVFGEALELFAAAARLDVLDDDGRRAAAIAVDAIAERWDEPDAGIWELEPQWWTHSRLACVAGLRVATEAGLRADRGDAEALAARIAVACEQRSVSKRGAWQRHPGDSRIDAALLLPSIRGADDAHAAATLAAVRAELSEDGYTFRYAPDDGDLGEDEGAFLLCGFIRSLAELQQGDEVAAWRSFERNRAACGPPGLMAEEFDVRQRQLRGNVPQAFVHALLLEASVRLGQL
jgi:hypothetical protein